MVVGYDTGDPFLDEENQMRVCVREQHAIEFKLIPNPVASSLLQNLRTWFDTEAAGATERGISLSVHPQVHANLDKKPGKARRCGCLKTIIENIVETR